AQKNAAVEATAEYNKDANAEAKKEAIINAAKKVNPQATNVTIDDEGNLPSNVGGPTNVAVTLHYADNSTNPANVGVTVTET
ncbi:hypothetical protein ACV3RS_17550, partial [Clostridium perfringens]